MRSRILSYGAFSAFCVLGAMPASPQDVRPSFNCARASFVDERVICETNRLAEMDQAAAMALASVKKSDMKTARETAFDQLKERHACGTNKVCILDHQEQVIEMMSDLGATVPVPPWVGAYRLSLIESGEVPLASGLPQRVGSCTRTKISAISSRFGETLQRPEGDAMDNGTAVDFANKGHQVSYSFVAAVADSAIGDNVALCLVSVPKDCPPGDDRGKIYSAVNMRTKGTWIMPDAQHVCGGA